ncbi:MAG: Stp1/IreP family PP2C-type Ser/Thr phosphatase [Acidobacteriota bacterium]
MVRIKSFGSTDVGLLRTHNEDCFDTNDQYQVYVVADGMGGHNHGEIASQIAVEAIRSFIVECIDNDGTLPIGYDSTLHQHSNQLKRSIHTAHDRVLEAIRKDGTLLGMGTTVVGAIHKEQIMAIAHVGDSRGYRLRDGHLELLTQDHTWVNEQVVAGYLSEEQAKSHPLKNVVTRALGGDSDIVVDVTETQTRSGDLFLLCSDGLTTMLSDEEIHERLVADSSLDSIGRRLIHDANARGGFDNVTVVLFKVFTDDEESNGRPRSGQRMEQRPPETQLA